MTRLILELVSETTIHLILCPLTLESEKPVENCYHCHIFSVMWALLLGDDGCLCVVVGQAASCQLRVTAITQLWARKRPTLLPSEKKQSSNNRLNKQDIFEAHF